MTKSKCIFHDFAVHREKLALPEYEQSTYREMLFTVCVDARRYLYTAGNGLYRFQFLLASMIAFDVEGIDEAAALRLLAMFKDIFPMEHPLVRIHFYRHDIQRFGEYDPRKDVIEFGHDSYSITAGGSLVEKDE